MTKNINVGFKRLSGKATLPTKAHKADSGFDLYASEDVIIEPGDTVIVKTGIAVELPAGYEAQIRPRSGVTAKTKLRVQLGTIDNGYKGEIGVIVDNISEPYDEYMWDNAFYGVDNLRYETVTRYPFRTYCIRKGDRIAQLVIQRLPAVSSYEIEGDLEQTDRGSGGFGSSGV